jgi:hypothetical protein
VIRLGAASRRRAGLASAGGIQPGGSPATSCSSLLFCKRPALKQAAEYPFFECGKPGADAFSWSRHVYDFIQRDATCLNQDDAVRQTQCFGDIMGHKHCSKSRGFARGLR